MKWSVERKDDVAVVEMRTDPVNKQNPDFFQDLHEAWDRLETPELAACPVVLTGQRDVFSTGIDFDYTFPLFEGGDLTEIESWFDAFSSAILRVFAFPRPTAAAVNGHALAGGLILALACDFRIAAAGDFRCGLNEVPAGIPMPSVYIELVRAQVGSRSMARAVLGAELMDPSRALEMGLYDHVVEPSSVLSRAIEILAALPPESFLAYGHSKAMIQRRTLDWIEQRAPTLERQTFAAAVQPSSVQAQKNALWKLKHR